MAWQAEQHVGAYIIEEQLGQGGMATVYKAYHPHLDRSVAIKVMHQKFLDDENFVTRFKREAQIVARLSHPHIVPVYDYDEYEGVPYLVMKYVPGITLKQRVRRQPLTLDEILAVMAPIASALAYAHRQGVLHRDVKPSNIVLDENGVPYLTDFGLARLAEAGESTMSAEMLLGTPHYISPEQARGQRNLDHRVDIYSFGIVLYELLVGQVPFTADTPYAIIHDHIYTPPPRARVANPEIPEGVAAVLDTALAKNPADRYNDTEELMAALKAAIIAADLQALDENRVSLAAASLSQLRQSAISANIPAAQGSQAVSYQSTEAPTAAVNKGQRWLVSGCIGALVFGLMSILILLSASNNLIQLVTIILGGDALPTIDQALPIEFRELGIEILDAPYSQYQIPSLTNDETQPLLDAFGDFELSYLAHAQALWQQGDTEAAIGILRRGYPQAENSAIYLMNAAQISDDRSSQIAVVFTIMALESADRTTFMTIRPQATQRLYEASQNAGLITRNDLARAFEDVNITDDISNTVLLGSDGARLVLANQLVNRETPRLAELALRDIPPNSPLRSEFDLLEAELAIQQEDLSRAERLLEAILDDDMAPAWLQDLADDLAEIIEDMEG